MVEDSTLLRAYAEEKSEEAFRTVVDRYVALVYSAALRQTSDSQLAQEVTQAVFIVLARKAGSLRPGTILAGWLFRTTRFAAARALRGEQRRRLREQEAAQMNVEPGEETNWQEIAPVLDEALARLGEKERHAVLLRFFERKEFKEVGSAIGSSEDAAKKRVSRSLEKLRVFLLRRGVALSVTALGTVLMQNAVQAAPAGLSSAASAAAIAGSGPSLALAIGTFKAMFLAKLKVAVSTCGVLLAVAGGGTLVAELEIAKSEPPDPVALLQAVKDARARIKSGEMEMETTFFQGERKYETNRSQLKIRFQGEKRRSEQFVREGSYTLVGPTPGDVSEQKMKALNYDGNAMERLGLLWYRDVHYVRFYDGSNVVKFTEGNDTVIDDPSNAGGEVIFDPRVLGLYDWLPAYLSLERDLPFEGPKSLKVTGKESVAGVQAWHVEVQTKYNERLEYWIDIAQPEHVLKLKYRGTVLTSKFDSKNPTDPIPIETYAVESHGGKTRLENRIVRSKTRYNVTVDPESWTLAGLGMPSGTSVQDDRLGRFVGYWNGIALQKSLPTNAVPRPHKEYPYNFGKLLAILQSEPKSLLGLACAMQIIRYAPDGAEVEKSADVIAREHASNKDLAYLCERLRTKSTRSAPMLLRTIVAANTNADVLAQASYSLATILKGQVAQAAPGPEMERTAQEAEKMFEFLITKFGEMKFEGEVLGERADKDLFELRFLRPGKVTQEITGRDADGETFSLKDYRGKVVLLVFSSRNCAPCVAMYPQFKAMLGRSQSQGFEVLGVMDDAKLRDLKRSIDEGKITWRCWWDGFQGPISQMWNVHSWPTLYLIDRKGVIRYRDLKGKALEDAVEHLVAEP